MPVQKDDYAGIAWLPTGEVIVARPVAPSGEVRLAFLDLASGELRDVPVPVDNSCWRQDFFSPRSIPDGRLGYLDICVHAANRRPPDDVVVRAFDVRTRSDEQLASIGPIGIHQNVQFAMAKDSTDIIVEIGAGICYGLTIFSKGAEPRRFDVSIGDGKQVFSLDVPVDLDGHCKETGRAGAPALSPLTSDLAFFASPASVGIEGLDRLGEPWNLYLLKSGSGAPTEVLRDVLNPGDLAWSPDGRHLAFGARTLGGSSGTWVVDPSGDNLRGVTASFMSHLAWSPDGSAVAGITPVDDPDNLLLDAIVVAPVDTSR